MTRRNLPFFALALGLASMLSGCVISVAPVIPESDAIFDERLIGSWQEVSGTDRAVVSAGDEKSYAIEYTTEGSPLGSDRKTTRFEGRLGRIGKRLVLDVWPAASALESNQLLIPGHMIFAIDVTASEIGISTVDKDTLAAALRSGEVRLVHERSEQTVLLEGTTHQLRSALDRYLRRSDAFSTPDRWVRAIATRPVVPVEPPCFEASAWHEADQLFHRDPHWLGADVASTVDLGGGRILWLFGDTWIDPSGAGKRSAAKMVSNSIGIQTGTDPATATISFYWQRAADGTPDAAFPDRGQESLWFGSGVRVGDRLVLFFARTLRLHDTPLGFESVGWTALMVENPDDDPAAWRVRTLDTPPNPLGVLVGFAAALRQGDHVYALGSQNPVKSHPIFAVRWPAKDVERGDLGKPEWWAGQRVGWVADVSSEQRWPLFEHGQSELTVHRDSSSERFIAVQSVGFGPADVALRAAPVLTGPWSSPRMLYRPPEYYRPHVMIYAAKAHPELTGADLVLTYATNTFEFNEQMTDGAIYYPRFVKLTRCGS